MKVFLALILCVTATLAYARIPMIRLRPSARSIVSKIRRGATWKNIAAGGAAAGTLVAAYKISNGMENGLAKAAERAPEAFLGTMILWKLLVLALLLLALAALVLKIIRIAKGKDIV